MKLSIQDDLWWGAKLRLESWEGFQGGGTVRLIFAPEGRELEPLTDDETALIERFVRDEPRISAAVKASLLSWCAPGAPERQGRFDFGDDFPAIHTLDDLSRNVGLNAVNIHQVDFGGAPYVGFEFGCSWDDEHGLGVLMHGERTVDIGGTDTAILLWIAEEDAGKQGWAEPE